MNQLGGTGPDADKGKERTQFENDRRTGNQGGKDRPPVYTPPTDYRGGYQTSASGGVMAKPNAKAKLGSGGRFAAFVQRLEGQGKSADSAAAIAASAGRKAHGAAAMARWSAKGRK
jgi:hypothetical protein